MPLAFASSMGGMATLIGTPPNLVVDEVLSNAGFTDLSFFSFTPIGGYLCAYRLGRLDSPKQILLGKKGGWQRHEDYNRALPKRVSQEIPIIG